MRKMVNLAGIALSAILLVTQQVNAQWAQFSGPEGGSVTCFAESGSYIFAGTGGGVLRTTVDGTSWTPVNSGLTNTVINTLAVNGTYLYAGTETGVFLSTNYGDSWTATSGGANIVVTSGSKIFSAGGESIYLSADSCKTYTKTGMKGYYIYSLAVSGTNIFAGTNGGVFLSTNNGTSWTQVNTGLTLTYNNVTSLVVNGTHIYAVTSNGIFMSPIIGIGWTKLNLSYTLYNVLSLLVIDDNKLLVGNNDGAFIYSFNGINWNKADTVMSSIAVQSFASSGNTIFAGSKVGVFRSTDNGMNWTQFFKGMKSLYRIQALVKNGTDLYAGTPVGLFVSPDNGSSWSLLNTNANVSSVLVNGTDIYLGIYGGGLYHSANNGISWNRNTDSNMQYQNVYTLVRNGNYIYAGTSSGLYLSKDTSSWTLISNSEMEVINSLAFSSDKKVLYAGDFNNGLYSSKDSGKSCTKWDINSTGVKHLAVVDSTIYAGITTNNGGAEFIYYSQDNGKTWNNNNRVFYIRSIIGVPNPDGGSVVFVSTQVGQTDPYVVFSTDNWVSSKQIDGISSSYGMSFALNGNEILMGTSGSGIYHATLKSIIPPKAPKKLIVADSAYNSVTLKWDKNTEADFMYYIVTSTRSNVTSVDTLKGDNADTTKTYSNLTFIGGYNNNYDFYVEAVDSFNNHSAISNKVSFSPYNMRPTAITDTITIVEDLESIIDVLSNDTDINGDRIILNSVSWGKYGSIYHYGFDSTFTYIPNANFSGTDTLTYIIYDIYYAEDTGTIIVKVLPVNDPPEFLNGLKRNFSFIENAHFAYKLDKKSILNYTQDVDNKNLNLIINGKNITSEMESDSIVLHTPHKWIGKDTLTVIVSDGELADTTTFIILIEPLKYPLTAFKLILPSSNSTIDRQSILFKWEASKDFAGDTVLYNLLITGPSLDTTISAISDTSFVFDGSKVFLKNIKYNWLIQATNGRNIFNSRTISDFYVSTTSTIDYNSQNTQNMLLEQNYPNPFTSSTKIQFSISSNNYVSLKIFDLYGKEVAQLVSSNLRGGDYVFDWNAVGLNAGIYICRLQVGNKVQTRKMSLVK